MWKVKRIYEPKFLLFLMRIAVVIVIITRCWITNVLRRKTTNIFVPSALVEPKALCYRAYVCVRNHWWWDLTTLLSQRKRRSPIATEELILPDISVNKIQNYDLEAESLSDQPIIIVPSARSPSLLRSRFLGCHAMGGALRDIPKNGCKGDYRSPRHNVIVHT